MAKFHFSLAPLLRLRTHERDLKREALAAVMQEHERRVNAVKLNEQTQVETLQQLQSITAAGKLDLNSCSQLRYYLAALKRDIVLLQQSVQDHLPEVEQARSELMLADQAVKALEKLETKQRTDFEFEHQKKEQLQLEDLWQAGQQVLKKDRFGDL